MATTNMVLTLPTVGVTVGPTWASLLNTALETIDSHDHTTGKGTLVPIAGISFNAAVNFNSNSVSGITTLSAASLTLSSGITVGSNIVSDTNNTDTLGTSGVRWANVFSVLGNFSGTITSSTIVPSSTNTYDLGSTSAQYSNLYVATILSNNSEVLVTDHFRPTANNTYESGGSSLRWSNVYSVLGNFSGNLTTSALVAAANDTHDIASAGTRYKDIYAGTLNLSKAAVTGITISSSTGIPGVFTNYSNDIVGPVLYLQKSRHATLGSNTIVQSGDVLGKIQFLGANGSGYTNAAEIQVSCAGTPGASNDMPGQVTFKTTPDGSGTLTDVLYLTSNQNVVPAGTLRPSADGTIDNGASSFLWDNGYFKNASFTENLAGPERTGQRSYRNNVFLWAYATANGASSPTLNAADAYNCSSITWNSTGNYTITASTAVVTRMALNATVGSTTAYITSIRQASSSTWTLRVFDAAGTLADIPLNDFLHIVGVGY